MDQQALHLGKLLIWADKRRGTFTYFDLEREFHWPRELAVALVKEAVDMGSIAAKEPGKFRRKRSKGN